MKKIIYVLVIIVIIIGSVLYISNTNRTLLTHEDYSGKNSLEIADKVAEGTLNTEAPTEWVTYKDNGIEFSVPYNPKWGTENYKIPPYEYIKNETFEGVIFGPIEGTEGGGLSRLLSLSVKTPRTTEEIMKKYEEYYKSYYKEDDKYNFLLDKTELKTLNKLQVVETTNDGFCKGSSIEIVGSKYNYLLSNTCDSSYERNSDNSWTTDMKFLEDLVNKINLI